MSCIRFSLSLLFATTLLLNAHGESEETLDLNAPPLGEYELKTKSSFSLDDATRPPFWPIGWVKRVQSTAEPTAAPVARIELSPDDFSVTSVLLGNPSLAVINGRAYGEGETLRAPKAAAEKAGAAKNRPRVRVKRILDGRVILEGPNGQTIDVALRRGKLSEPKPGQDLLDEQAEE